MLQIFQHLSWLERTSYIDDNDEVHFVLDQHA